jgi:DNA-directed RNA polymerase subunit RPC12/RpoP
MIEKCLSCGRNRIERGSLHTSDIKVSAYMCLDCGYIHLGGDVEKANVLVDEKSDLQ